MELRELVRRGSVTWNKWRKENPALQVNLDGTDLRGMNMNSMDLFMTSLVRVNLRRAYLLRADLRASSLVEADMQGAFLIQADLRGANVRAAQLQEANLTGADLSNTNLSGADFHQANLSGADLHGSLLIGTQLSGADLSGANLTGACIEGWTINASTQMEDLTCQHVFLSYQASRQRKFNRFPPNERQSLGPNEFAQVFQQATSTIELLFPAGINWSALLQSYQKVRDEHGNEPIVLRGLEVMPNGDLVIKVDIPITLNRPSIEAALKEAYTEQKMALEDSYRQEFNLPEPTIKRIQTHYRDVLAIVQKLATATTPRRPYRAPEKQN